MNRIICYCDGGMCPNNEQNGTCVLKRGGQCFSAIEEVYDVETRTYEPSRSFGCLPPDEKSLMQCMGDLVPHMYGKSIKCCNFTDLCNQNLLPEYKPHTTMTPPSFFLQDTHYVALLASFSVCLTVCFLLISLFYFRYKRKEGSQLFLADPCNKLLHKTHNTLQEVINLSSGSGAGYPMLVPRTISRDVEVLHPIGKGRFSEVCLAHFKGERIAVKKYSLLDEDNWLHERTVYTIARLRHKNVLNLIAGDKLNGVNGTQLLLITDYYELGTLYEYLYVHDKVLDTSDLVRLSKSAAIAINYLHTEIFAEHGKPGVVHRDVKSKNFLINNNMECVIMDFGMAAMYSSRTNYLDLGKTTRIATKRYMAPELLDGTINMDSFDELKMTDIYSLSLVFWEMCRKCVTLDGVRLRCEDYASPYYDVVSVHPSFEEIREAVAVKKIRPLIPDRWNMDPTMKIMTRIIEQCWNSNPASRLTALRLKKTLDSLSRNAVSMRIV